MQQQNSFASGGQRTITYNRRNKSPVFSFTNTGTLANGAYLLFDYHRDNTATEKYGAFNNLRVFNGSTELIIVYPNQDKNQGIPVASGTSEIITGEAVAATTSILIYNADASATISANEIRIQIWKDERDLQEIASRIHRDLFEEPKSLTERFSEFLGATKKSGGGAL